MKTCVYTVLLGGYDALLDQDVAAASDSTFVCFTDDPTLQSDTWEIVVVEPRFPQDLHRSSRVLKILGHDRLEEFDASLCIDASVLLRKTPEVIISEWLAEDADMALARHSYRAKIIDEFDEVVRLNYDDSARVYEQLVDYSLFYPDVLEAPPHWGGMLVRRRTPAVESAMRLWFDHVLRYSRRDQLSLMVALLHGGIRYRSIEIDNFDSEYQQWPVITERRVASGKAASYSSGPLIAELRRAQRRVTELEEALDDAATEAREELSAVRAALAETQVRSAEVEAAAAFAVEEREKRVDELVRAVAATSGVRGATRNLTSQIARRIKRRA